MWRSKLGQDYEKSFMEKNEKNLKADLDRMRKRPDNSVCADCGVNGTVWASVNLGVFLCLRCGSIHRGMGTHVSIPKGCTGTYLWGPDELENMRTHGNSRAQEIYGGDDQRPPRGAGDDAWRKYIRDKYEVKLFAPAFSKADNVTVVRTSPLDVSTVPDTTLTVEEVNTTEDLISFDPLDVLPVESKTAEPPDFFKEFGL